MKRLLAGLAVGAAAFAAVSVLPSPTPQAKSAELSSYVTRIGNIYFQSWTANPNVQPEVDAEGWDLTLAACQLAAHIHMNASQRQFAFDNC